MRQRQFLWANLLRRHGGSLGSLHTGLDIWAVLILVDKRLETLIRSNSCQSWKTGLRRSQERSSVRWTPAMVKSERSTVGSLDPVLMGKMVMSLCPYGRRVMEGMIKLNEHCSWAAVLVFHVSQLSVSRNKWREFSSVAKGVKGAEVIFTISCRSKRGAKFLYYCSCHSNSNEM